MAVSEQRNCFASVSLVSGYQPGNHISFASGARGVAVHQHNQTNSPSCPVRTGCFLPALKWTGFEPDHSPPSNTEVKNV